MATRINLTGFLPNLEEPGAPDFEPWTPSVPPAWCFAPVRPRTGSLACRTPARPTKTGKRGRAPYLPEDFDPRVLSDRAGRPGLRPEVISKAARRVEVQGATPPKAASCASVCRKLTCRSRMLPTDGQAHRRPAVSTRSSSSRIIDRVQLVWRAVLQCDKKALRVNEVHASLGQLVGSVALAMAAQQVVVVGVGMMTAVGLTAAETAASVRAAHDGVHRNEHA